LFYYFALMIFNLYLVLVFDGIVSEKAVLVWESQTVLFFTAVISFDNSKVGGISG